MAKLLYQGHGSFRITTDNGMVIYVDPYAGEGYDIPANLILVTHQHSDHNQISLVPQMPECQIITNEEAMKGGVHNKFSLVWAEIEAVTAENDNHNPKVCVGYIISVDGIVLYAAGDTSKTVQMSGFSSRNLDYALLPCDGIYNMNPEEAAQCAKIIGAKHNIPIHMAPGALFDRTVADAWDAPNKLIIEPGGEINL